MAKVSCFQRLALWTIATTYLLILVGGLVRASGAGLGCPDWPRCFGSWIPPSSASDLPPQFDPSLFNPVLMWTEYLNRLLGVTVGILILATVIAAWRHHRHRPRILWSSTAAFLLTGFQGWLGGRVVALELASWIVTVHLVFALVIVQCLVYAIVSTRRIEARPAHRPRRREARVMFLLTLTTMCQIAIGTQVRAAVDAALDAGIPRSRAVASVGMLDYLHRDAAIIVFAGSLLIALWLWSKPPRERALVRWACAVASLGAAQIALGIVMAYGSLLVAAQVLHLTIASLLLGAETVLLLILEPSAIATTSSN